MCKGGTPPEGSTPLWHTLGCHGRNTVMRNGPINNTGNHRQAEKEKWDRKGWTTE